MMKKLMALAWFFVFLISTEVDTSFVEGSSRLSFQKNPQNLEHSQYVTVIGCNNDCDTTCCSCNIEKQPPLCELCCQED
ncbi:hypothetical protein Pint_02881 [Pistacia integerrima]|uniref:Uncharacterized protein n=1 Tax=Pistacia integerrima TaxID=434235 RepID=A0ACC0ZHF7_9ROSI|nr:hypothetical protein Pint_02881 [Pistacia integerrima]